MAGGPAGSLPAHIAEVCLKHSLGAASPASTEMWINVCVCCPILTGLSQAPHRGDAAEQAVLALALGWAGREPWLPACSMRQA